MRVTDNVYMLDSSHHSHVYLVTTPEPVLIDTGMGFEGHGMRRELESLGFSDIRHILLTHHDVDHIGNAARWQAATGAAVHASTADIPYITGEMERHSFKKYIGRLAHVPSPANLVPFEDGAEINGIRVIPTPGHTPGHLCFLYQDVLFVGDLLKNKKQALIPYPASWDWDYEMLLESVRTVSEYPFTWVCPAHGRPVKRGDSLKPR
jgi:glyoxylase-like metal-dependent hydrolase (beta-lactamase superfamily II)